jgi:putative transposase
MYPVVFFDALRVKIRSDGVVSNKAVYLALGVQADGQRDVFGLWIEQTEGAKFWLKVFNDLKTRGCNDILVAVVDGLKGLADAISVVYPRTTVQTCIVHLIRNSLDYAGWKDRKAVAQALRPIYGAASEQAAEQALVKSSRQGPWGAKYPTIVASVAAGLAARHVPFFVFPPDIRRVIYTTNAIESLNVQLRKIIKTRGHFPNDEAAIKLLWLALRNVLAKSVRAAFDWKVSHEPVRDTVRRATYRRTRLSLINCLAHGNTDRLHISRREINARVRRIWPQGSIRADNVPLLPPLPILAIDSNNLFRSWIQPVAQVITH